MRSASCAAAARSAPSRPSSSERRHPRERGERQARELRIPLRSGVQPAAQALHGARVVPLEKRLHALGVVAQGARLGAAAALGERGPEGLRGLAEVAALEVGASGALVGRRHRPEHLAEQARQIAAEDRGEIVALLDQQPRCEPVVRLGAEQPLELDGGLLQQRLGLLESLGEADAALGEDLLELPEQLLAVFAGGGAQRAHLGTVDGMLVEVLAELHALVEERSDREVEERPAADAGLAVVAEQLVAALLEAKEHCFLAVADQPLDALEAQLAAPVERGDGAELAVRAQEIAHDLDQGQVGGGAGGRFHRASIRTLAGFAGANA